MFRTCSFRAFCLACLIAVSSTVDVAPAAAAKPAGAQTIAAKQAGGKKGQRRPTAGRANPARRSAGGRASAEKGMPYAARADWRMWRWLFSNESVANSIK